MNYDDRSLLSYSMVIGLNTKEMEDVTRVLVSVT